MGSGEGEVSGWESWCRRQSRSAAIMGCAVSCRQEMMREVDRGDVQGGDGVRNDVGYIRDKN